MDRMENLDEWEDGIKEKNENEEKSLVNKDKLKKFEIAIDNFKKENELESKGWKSISLLLNHRYTEKGLEQGLLKGIDFQIWNYFANVLGKKCQTTPVVVQTIQDTPGSDEGYLTAYEFSGKVLLGHVKSTVIRKDEDEIDKERNKDETDKDENRKNKDETDKENKDEIKNEDETEIDKKNKNENRKIKDEKAKENEDEKQDYNFYKGLKKNKKGIPILLVPQLPERNLLKYQEGAEYTGNESLEEMNWYYCAAMVINL